MKKIYLPIALSLVLAAGSAVGETWGPKTFTYYGSANNVTYAGFNPRYSYVPPGEQLNFQFYGTPRASAGCPNPMYDGAATPVAFTNAQSNTGLPVLDSSRTWSPTADWRCATPGVQGWTHAHLNNANSTGGIGIYTHTGPNPLDGTPVFLEATPVGAGSTLAYGGIIVAFNKATSLDLLPRPFTGNSTDNNVRRMAVITVQGIAKFGLESPSLQQVRQQTEVNLIHKGCSANVAEPNRICEIQIQFFNAINASNASSLQASLIFDGGQGGKAVFGGNYGPYSAATVWSNPFSGSHVLWTSWANPTQSSTFADKAFQAEVTFNNLINMMCITVAAKIGQPNATLITAAQAQKYFGGATTSYADPNEWVLKTVVVSHEVVNQNQSSSRAYIGGRVRSLEVLALPF